MALLTRYASLIAIWALTSCGSIVDDSYRGVPLLELRGQIFSFDASVPATASYRASVFWSNDGTFDLSATNLVEQPGLAVEVDFPSAFTINVFEPPSGGLTQSNLPYRLGFLVIYEDLDGNGKFTEGEVRGGASDVLIVHADAAVDAADSISERPLQPGYQLVRIPLECHCGANLGIACTDNESCGTNGVCIDEIDDLTFPGGFCMVELKQGRCYPKNSFHLEYDDGVGGMRYLAHQTCRVDGECRAAEGYKCCAGFCLPDGLICDDIRQCDFRLGEPCTANDQCGADGTCLTTFGTDTFPNGYCAGLDHDDCITNGGVLIPREDRATNETVIRYLKTCDEDADCRTGEGYVCGTTSGICEPVQPVYIQLETDFEIVPRCFEFYDPDPL